MALLDLSKGQLQLIQNLIRSENPGLANADLNAYFNRPYKPTINEDGTVTLHMTGKSGGAVEGGFGSFDFKYNRIDLNKYFLNVVPEILVYQPTGLADILFALSDLYGLVISEDIVEPVTISGVEGTIVLVFKTNYVISNPTFTFTYREPDYLHLEDLYRQPKLPGFTPPWPYAKLVDEVFQTKSLAGFSKPQILWYLDKITSQWSIDDADLAAWLNTLTVGGGYDSTKLAQVVTLASESDFGDWQCTNGSGLPNNLWNTYIAYNGVPRPGAFGSMFNREIELTPSVGYLPQGRGSIHVYYNVLEG